MDLAEASGEQVLRIALFYEPERGDAVMKEIELPTGATVAQALQVSGLLDAYPELATPDIRPGIDGRRVTAQQAVSDGDRIDLCRPLQIDPMSARRLRAAAARKNAGSKPGG